MVVVGPGSCRECVSNYVRHFPTSVLGGKWRKVKESVREEVAAAFGDEDSV